MAAAGAGRLGGDVHPVAAPDTAEAPSLPGRIVIPERVLAKVSEQAAATILGVDRRAVKVQLGQARGGMAVSVSSPLPVPDLDDTAAIRAGATVLERLAAMQAEVRDVITALTGTEVARVNITITGAVIAQKPRVR